jgi:hypothetical protein
MTPTFFSYVEARFQAFMSAEYPTMKLYYANPPLAEQVGEYAVIHILASEDVLPTNLGIESKSRNVGIVQVDVYTPKDTGAGEGQAIAYYASRIFKRQVLSVDREGVVTFKDPSVMDRGEVHGKHKEQMRCPYRYDFKDSLL